MCRDVPRCAEMRGYAPRCAEMYLASVKERCSKHFPYFRNNTLTTVTHGADHVNAPLSVSFPGARVVRAPSGPDSCDQDLLINRHAQARLKGRLASLRHPLDCKNLTFLSTGAGGQHDLEGQSWSSTADPYIRRPGWHRQQARAALSASLGLVRAAGSAKQLSRQNQNVQEAAQATPDRAWP